MHSDKVSSFVTLRLLCLHLLNARMQSTLNEGNFRKFGIFFGSLILELHISTKRNPVFSKDWTGIAVHTPVFVSRRGIQTAFVARI